MMNSISLYTSKFEIMTETIIKITLQARFNVDANEKLKWKQNR